MEEVKKGRRILFGSLAIASTIGWWLLQVFLGTTWTTVGITLLGIATGVFGTLCFVNYYLGRRKK